jgi:cysteine desulfurase
MLRAFDAGNPSSVHAAARAPARSRRRAPRWPALVGAAPGSVFFVSGGTEANALAIGSAPSRASNG